MRFKLKKKQLSRVFNLLKSNYNKPQVLNILKKTRTLSFITFHCIYL